MLKKWADLPEFMQIDEVKPYYEVLQKKKVSLALLFYFRSGALLKEYSMDSENPKEVKVERMLLNIMDVGYIRGLIGIWIK